MHFALLREHVRNELGQEPEEAFATFDPRAFAAASLGQVHRATLKSGEDVAVKIQYPAIGRSIRSDFRNLSALLLAAKAGAGLGAYEGPARGSPPRHRAGDRLPAGGRVAAAGALAVP